VDLSWIHVPERDYRSNQGIWVGVFLEYQLIGATRRNGVPAKPKFRHHSLNVRPMIPQKISFIPNNSFLSLHMIQS
jgi:hypothetical protein